MTKVNINVNFKKKQKSEDEVIYKFETVRFKRYSDSEYETGILLNDGSSHLLDRFGDKVRECWDYFKTDHLVFTTDIFRVNQEISREKAHRDSLSVGECNGE